MDLPICQLRSNFFPGNIFFSHKNHHMVKEVADFILNFIGVDFGGDNDFGGLFSQFFQDFINAFVKQIIGVRTLLGILLTILDNGKTSSKTFNGLC